MKAFFLVAFFICNVAQAGSVKVLNVFYDENNQALSINTVEAGASGFMHTRKLDVFTNRVSICKNGCSATIKALSAREFAIMVRGTQIATVTALNADNLIPSQGFLITSGFGQDQLVLDLDKLATSPKVLVK